MSVVIPDEAEVRIGWRCWRLRKPDPDDVGYVLHSVNEIAWTPHQRLRARCVQTGLRYVSPYTDENVHDFSPAKGCNCGIYAKKVPWDLGDYAQAGVVIGTVKQWGRIYEGDMGVRSQYAYPDRLYYLLSSLQEKEPQWHKEARCRVIGEAYGVECSPLSMVEWAEFCQLEYQMKAPKEVVSFAGKPGPQSPTQLKTQQMNAAIQSQVFSYGGFSVALTNPGPGLVAVTRPKQPQLAPTAGAELKARADELDAESVNQVGFFPPREAISDLLAPIAIIVAVVAYLIWVIFFS